MKHIRTSARTKDLRFTFTIGFRPAGRRREIQAIRRWRCPRVQRIIQWTLNIRHENLSVLISAIPRMITRHDLHVLSGRTLFRVEVETPNAKRQRFRDKRFSLMLPAFAV